MSSSQHNTKKIKRLLKEYEDSHPDKTANSITTALMGRGDHSLTDIINRLKTELQHGSTSSDQQRAGTRYQLREWVTLCEYLEQLSVSHTDLRKYHSAYTPDRVAPKETKIIATGRLSAYKLSDSEYASLVCQATPEQTDGQLTEFKVAFTESQAIFFNRVLAPNNWYRRKDIQA